MKRMQMALAATLVSVFVLATGCSQNESPEARVKPAPTGITAVPVDPEMPAEPSAGQARTRNDLAVSPFRRTFDSAGLTITVAYVAVPAVDKWTPTGTKSVRLFMTAVNTKNRDRKIYLTRTSVQVGLRDADGEIPGSYEPVVDVADVSPGTS